MKAHKLLCSFYALIRYATDQPTLQPLFLPIQCGINAHELHKISIGSKRFGSVLVATLWVYLVLLSYAVSRSVSSQSAIFFSIIYTLLDVLHVLD